MVTQDTVTGRSKELYESQTNLGVRGEAVALASKLLSGDAV